MTAPDTRIDTARLALRVLTVDDAPDVFRYASDPAVARYTSWSPHRSLADAIDYVHTVARSDSSEPGRLRHVWSIRCRPDRRMVGTIDLVQDSDTEAHLDFALAREHWGRGIMTEAARAVVAWAFAYLPSLTAIHSGCLVDNIGSIKVLEKVGFQFRSSTTAHRPPKFAGRAMEAAHFVCTRATHEARPDRARHDRPTAADG